jgi:hypothetical protein
MFEPERTLDPGLWILEGPQSALERKLIEEYLYRRGYELKDLQVLQTEEARHLKEAACCYASLKLAEVEAKARFRKEIRQPWVNKRGGLR